MALDPKAILQEIIDQDGECQHWATPAICKICPLGRKRIDGQQRLNCMDYVAWKRPDIVKTGADDLIAEAYKEIAEEELFAMELEEVLE